MNKKIIFISFTFAIILIAGCFQEEKGDNKIRTVQQEKIDEDKAIKEKIACGGWNIFGQVICECDGILDKNVCPPDAVCDGGTYLCEGICGECECLGGYSRNKTLCEQAIKYFK